jgi:hypothetical protein
MWSVILAAAIGLTAAPVGTRDEVLRSLTRIERQAYLVMQHPDWADDEAQAAQRTARSIEDQLNALDPDVDAKGFTAAVGEMTRAERQRDRQAEARAKAIDVIARVQELQRRLAPGALPPSGL